MGQFKIKIRSHVMMENSIIIGSAAVVCKYLALSEFWVNESTKSVAAVWGVD
jgi:hypothetical protein